jgi:hypothetical protein
VRVRARVASECGSWQVDLPLPPVTRTHHSRSGSFSVPVSREGRENRPQLRCGNASQTRTASRCGGASERGEWRVKSIRTGLCHLPLGTRRGQSQSEQLLRRRRGRGRAARGVASASGRWRVEIPTRHSSLALAPRAQRAICGVRTSAPGTHAFRCELCARRLAKTSSQK